MHELNKIKNNSTGSYNLRHNYDMNIISKDEPNYKRNDSIISIRKVNRKISEI